MLETLSFFGAASLLLMLGSLLAEIAISVVVSEELMSYSISVTDAIDETFSGRWLHGIGQALLKIAIVAGAAIIVIIAAAPGCDTRPGPPVYWCPSTSARH